MENNVNGQNVVNNGTENANNVNGQVPAAEQNPQAAPQAAQPVVVVQQQPAATVKQDGWFKRNWKKVAIGAGTVLTAVGSAVVAYKKGKQQGVCVGMDMSNNDGSISPLDPNVE